MKKLLGLMSIISTLSFGAEDVDPANLTKVKTQGQLLGYRQDEDYGFKLMGSIGGSYSEKTQFMGMLEADFMKGEYSSMRAQYFQAFTVDNEAFPRLGFSIDYIKPDGLNMDMKAVGLLAQVKSPWKNVLFFPNVAYVNSKVGDNSFNGYQLNLYTSIYLNADGRYFMPHVAYTDIDYARYAEVNLIYGQPVSKNRRFWVVTKLEQDINIENYGKDTLRFSLGTNYYF